MENITETYKIVDKLFKISNNYFKKTDEYIKASNQYLDIKKAYKKLLEQIKLHKTNLEKLELDQNQKKTLPDFNMIEREFATLLIRQNVANITIQEKRKKIERLREESKNAYNNCLKTYINNGVKCSQDIHVLIDRLNEDELRCFINNYRFMPYLNKENLKKSLELGNYNFLEFVIESNMLETEFKDPLSKKTYSNYKLTKLIIAQRNKKYYEEKINEQQEYCDFYQELSNKINYLEKLKLNSNTIKQIIAHFARLQNLINDRLVNIKQELELTYSNYISNKHEVFYLIETLNISELKKLKTELKIKEETSENLDFSEESEIKEQLKQYFYPQDLTLNNHNTKILKKQ